MNDTCITYSHSSFLRTLFFFSVEVKNTVDICWGVDSWSEQRIQMLLFCQLTDILNSIVNSFLSIEENLLSVAQTAEF